MKPFPYNPVGYLISKNNYTKNENTFNTYINLIQLIKVQRILFCRQKWKLKGEKID